jgi:outer membrane protein assembly factor BamA
VDVRVGGALGPRVRITGTRIEGLAVTRPGVATRALGVTPGMTYHPGAARAAAARLSQLGVFTGAEFTGIEGGPRWEEGVLAFRVREPRYNRFEGAVGLQGEAGVAGLAVLELGNLLGTARAAELAWQSRGRGLSDLRMRYREPFVLGLPVSADLGLLQELQDSTYTRTRWGVRIGHTLGSGDRVEAGLEEERVVRTRGTAVTVGSTNTVFAYERDGRDDRLAPRRGTRVRLSGTGVAKRSRANTAGAVESRSRAGVAAAIVEWNRPLGPSTGLSWEVRGDGRFASEGVLEDHERTPVGGANTLRGQDEAAFRADRVVLSRLEWRAFPGSAGERVALFWDHARMWTRVDLGEGVTRPETRDVDGVGLGLRLRAAGGWVDVDYGLEPGRGFLEGRVHLRLVSTF